ncbi:MAG: hypothetical protein GY795_30570 [Desulfobacterales bacterium]|nr:hypothetical protein [Desulfobacterales bacterium]
MSKEITLQMLIDKVKSDLMSAPVEPENLLFFVEKVELELGVSIIYEAEAGIKISLLEFFKGEAKGKAGKEKGHTIKVSLTPVIPVEEQRAILNNNPRLKQLAESATIGAMWKSGDGQLKGEPE